MTDLMVVLLALEALILLSLIWNLSRRVKRLEEYFYGVLRKGLENLEKEGSEEFESKTWMELAQGEPPECSTCGRLLTKTGKCLSCIARKRWADMR